MPTPILGSLRQSQTALVADLLQYEPTREGFYWNDHIRAEQKAADHFEYDEKTARSLREQGFGLVHSILKDGIARGSGLVVALADQASDAGVCYQPMQAKVSPFVRASKAVSLIRDH